MNLLAGMLMFTIEDGPKYWFIRGEVNKTLKAIVSIHNKNCKFVKKGISSDNETIQQQKAFQDFEFDDTLNEKKPVAEIEQKDKKICIEALSKELSLDEYDLNRFDVKIKILKNLEDQEKKLTPFKLLFSKDYRWVFLGLYSMYVALFSLYYSTSFDTNTLDFGSTNINTIFFAVPYT